MIVVECKKCKSLNLQPGRYYGQFHCPICNRELEFYDVTFTELNMTIEETGEVTLEKTPNIGANLGV